MVVPFLYQDKEDQVVYGSYPEFVFTRRSFHKDDEN